MTELVHLSSSNHIQQSPWCSTHDIASPWDLSYLVSSADSTINHHWTHACPTKVRRTSSKLHIFNLKGVLKRLCHSLNLPKGKLPGLQVNLVDELSGWGHYDGLRLLQLAEATGCHTVCHQLLQNREQECSLEERRYIVTPSTGKHAGQVLALSLSSHRFPRSGLCTGHEISASRDDWDAVLLHRGRLHITGLADVFLQGLAQCCLLKSLKEKGLKCWLSRPLTTLTDETYTSLKGQFTFVAIKWLE